MKPKWLSEVRADQPQHVVLADGDQGAVDDRDQRQGDDERGGPLRRVGEQPEAVAQHRVGADLVEDADQQHAGAGRGLPGGVGQPGVHREQRRLDREREEEAREQPLLRVGVDVDLGELAEQVRRVAGVRGHGVEADDRGQHDEATGQLEDQELDRGLLPAHASEVADQEVARDERGLEEHVEQEDVGRHEHTQRGRLESQGPGEERLGVPLVGVEPRGTDDDRHEHRGQQHQHQAQAVDAEGVVGAEDVDPLVGLGELEAAVSVVLGGHHARQHQRQQREAQSDLLRPRLVALVGHGGRHDRADERHDDQGGQPREVVPGSPRNRERRSEAGEPNDFVGCMRSSPPGARGRRGARRRAGKGRRSGRSRSGCGAGSSRCP